MEKIIDLIVAYGVVGLVIVVLVVIPFTIYAFRQIDRANKEIAERRKKHFHL
jgi:hypothetical protein